MVLAVVTLIYYSTLPSPDKLFDGRGTGSVTLMDKDGNVFAWRGEQYGGELRADDVSPHLIHAVIAAEDKRYWNHFGIDPRGIARALSENIKAGRMVQGGSTLTQQVAKNVFLTAERSLERKLKEVPMALALELKYSKQEILSIYLNRVYLGAGTYGFEAAARRYFGKSARGLNPAEAAMLAGLLRAPSRYAPTAGLERSQGRASVIIRLMEDQGYLTEKQTLDALSNPARLSTAAAARAGGAFADWVMETAPSYLTEDTTEDVTIATTFDPRAQKAAESAVAAVFENKVKEGSKAQAAVVVLDHSGAVRAMVGGHGDGTAQFNRATQAKRQTGSAFKPIVYAAGLEAGMSPADIVFDEPITIKNWSPRNYTGRYEGEMTLTEALAHSINTVAVRVSERAGRAKVRALASEMGVTTELAPGPAIALGTSETTLIDMTGVYATIANRGRLATPYGVRSITLRGDDQPLLRHDQAPGEQVISEETAGLLAYMMREVVESGTGRRARIPGWEIAGKTGTTQAARDAWFIGYTADYVVGVWMGNDDNSPLTGVTGGGLPAEIWREVTARLEEGHKPRPIFIRQPAPPQVAVNASTDGGRSGRTGQDSVVQSIFKDVLRSLTGERKDDDVSFEAGSDR
ncbi:PBP1A family penicillin-binding protein [Rhodobacteraceae bacterium NNCM2]|nr:PBP1A family penicillin-binding protein [Coraliihabitans acroporae]